MEFEESRPYLPGDNIRHLDSAAMARTGEPYVKHFREERDQALLLLLDVSASMRFGTTGRAKATTAAHAVALLATAAGQVGDRVGLLTFDSAVREQIPPGSGPAHTWRVVEMAVSAARETAGGTHLAAAIEATLAMASHRCAVALISDFRDGHLFDTLAPPAHSSRPLGSLASLCAHHDVVSIVVGDPREATLPTSGLVRMADSERPGRRLLVNTSSAAARERYLRAWQLRSRALARSLRAAGSDLLTLDTADDPLRSLMRFFRARSQRAPRSGGR
jgi:uncharacterized protein (DUF58 family)